MIIDLNYVNHSFLIDKCGGIHTHLPKTGRTHIELKFASELTKPITVLVYAFYQKLMKFKRVSKEFPPTVEYARHI